MNITAVICPDTIEEKLAVKHHLTVDEAEQIVWSPSRIRFAEEGHIPGNDVYAAFGQTWGGRYIIVFFVYKPETTTAIIISARNMSDKERRAYGRK